MIGARAVTSNSEEELRLLLAATPFPSVEATRCPYPLYAALHRDARVHRLGSGEYVIAGHEEISYLVRHPEIFSSRHTVSEDGWMRAATLDDLERDIPWAIVSSDPPDHAPKRKLAFEMFKPGRLRARQESIRAHVDTLLDRFIGDGRCEFVSQFAELLPARVIMDLFGLPFDDLERVLAWGRYEGFGTRFASPERQAAARDGIMDLGAFLRELILERIQKPSADELSGLVARHCEHHGELRLPNLIAEASNLFIGGIITTTHLLSSMMMLLIRHPDQQVIARQGRTELRRAVEETLRYESPIQMGPRLVLCDVELGGAQIPRGATVLVVWGAANRDATVFDCPGEFRVDRARVKEHLAFGGGPHFCLGAPLARLEALTAFEQIFARMQNLRFAPAAGEPDNRPAVIFRGPAALEIEFDPV